MAVLKLRINYSNTKFLAHLKKMRQNQFLNFLILSFSTRTQSVFQCRLTNGPPEEVAQNLGQLQVWPKICQRFIWISSVFDRKLFKAVFIMSSLWYFLLFQRLCICTNYIMFNCWPSKHAYIPRPWLCSYFDT